MPCKLCRIVLLGSVLFLSGFSTVSAQSDLKGNPGFVVIPIEKMDNLLKDVQSLLKENDQLGRALERANDTIRNGMGCT